MLNSKSSVPPPTFYVSWARTSNHLPKPEEAKGGYE